MKIGQTAKQIDSVIKMQGYVYNRNFGDYLGTCTTWNDKLCKWNKVDSTFVARKYSQIFDIVKETNATVKINGDVLQIFYNTGRAGIKIDELVKAVLIPALKTITPVN